MLLYGDIMIRKKYFMFMIRIQKEVYDGGEL